MGRKAFDTIITAGGLVVTTVLLVAGSLLLWGAHFANSSVHDQLAQQQIFFPAAGSPALAPANIGPYLNKYAGQQLTTGPQAKAYADHFIGVHVSEIANGQTYAQVSTAAQADPTNTKLASEKTSLFQGQTLRGLLLEAYGFGEMGHIAQIAAMASFALAAVMLLMTLLGFAHLRRVNDTAEVFVGRTTRQATPVAV
jgi:hypothetical protein